MRGQDLLLRSLGGSFGLLCDLILDLLLQSISLFGVRKWTIEKTPQRRQGCRGTGEKGQDVAD